MADRAGLLAFLCKYVTRRPSGVILIHGDWRSGKSTYVRQHVMTAINAKVVNGKPLKALYLSVAGATTSDDLDTALLRAVYPGMALRLRDFEHCIESGPALAPAGAKGHKARG